MNHLIPFDHPEFGSIRLFMDPAGNPWWIAADVCRALELSNVTKALLTLKSDEKMTLTDPEGHSGQRGGPQFYNLVNEPGLYRLIHKSRTPAAERFQHWNFHEVLPSFRMTGHYVAPARPALDIVAIEAENKRLLASMLNDLAASGLYTTARAAAFKAEAVSALSGKPMTEYLPAVADGRHKWLSPTALGERVGLSAKIVGTVLKRNNLHGETDEDHAHSQPITNKSPHSAREVTSYLYDPAVVLPVLQAAAASEAAQPVKKRAKIKPAITLIS